MRFVQNNKQMEIARIMSPLFFFKDTGLCLGDFILMKSSTNSCYIGGQILNFRCANGRTKSLKRYNFKYFIFGVNNNVSVKLSPVFLLNDSFVISSYRGTEYHNLDLYVCSFKPEILDLNEMSFLHGDIESIKNFC
jgi:hypothetical protein